MSATFYIVNHRTKRMFEIGIDGESLSPRFDVDEIGSWVYAHLSKFYPRTIWIRDQIVNIIQGEPRDCDLTDESKASFLRMAQGYEKVGAYAPIGEDFSISWLKDNHPGLHAMWRVIHD